MPIGAGTSKYNIYDDRIATEAETWIAREAQVSHGKPWVLFIGFVAPHFPLTVPQEFLDLYPVSRDAAAAPASQGRFPAPSLARAVASHPPSRRRARRCWTPARHGLLLWPMHLGRPAGRPRHRRRRASGLAETTRIVYTSDHGDNIGARGIWGKSTHYDDAVGVPMILAGPDVAAGRRCRTPVSLVDMAPTILDCVGEQPYAWSPSPLPGRSLLEIGAKPDDEDRTVFSEYHAFASPTGAFMVRDGR